jgi:hypothetical protein
MRGSGGGVAVMGGAAHFMVPRLGVKGAFGVARSSRLASLALDTEPLAAPGRGQSAGRGWKDALPALRAALPERVNATIRKCVRNTVEWGHDEIG